MTEIEALLEREKPRRTRTLDDSRLRFFAERHDVGELRSRAVAIRARLTVNASLNRNALIEDQAEAFLFSRSHGAAPRPAGKAAGVPTLLTRRLPPRGGFRWVALG